MKEFASEPGRTQGMKETGWMISKNHEGMAKVLKEVIKDLKSQQEGIKKRKRTKLSKKRS